MQESVTPDAATALESVQWSLGTRVLFRFTFAYFVLFAAPAIEMVVPSMEWIARGYFAVQYRITPWVGKHVLGIPRAISVSELSSGDRATDYIAFLCIVVLAVAITIVWSIADRRARAYPRLDAALRITMRFVLAAHMLMYGVIKLFKGQFGAPSLDALTMQLGEFPPMGLLWNFMGYSRPYTFFGGFMETVGGLLLFFRRTAMLGALTVAAVMLNVVMLNFSYHVTVKLNSLNFFFWALVLAAPHAQRLFDFFLLNRATTPEPPYSFVVGPRAVKAARVAQAAVIAFSVYASTASALLAVREYGDDVPKHPLFGIYDVTSFLVNGEPAPPLLGDARRWRRMIIDAKGWTRVRRMNDTEMGLALDSKEPTFTFSAPDGRKNVFTYAQPARAELELTGSLGDDAIVVRFTRIDETQMPLLRERFHWINPRSWE